MTPMEQWHFVRNDVSAHWEIYCWSDLDEGTLQETDDTCRISMCDRYCEKSFCLWYFSALPGFFMFSLCTWWVYVMPLSGCLCWKTYTNTIECHHCLHFIIRNSLSHICTQKTTYDSFNISHIFWFFCVNLIMLIF